MRKIKRIALGFVVAAYVLFDLWRVSAKRADFEPWHGS